MMDFHASSPGDQVRFTPADSFAAGLAQHHIANTAYPVHPSCVKEYRVTGDAAQELAARGWDGLNDLGLYVHIPFCEQRCAYCEYCVVEPDEFKASEDEYFDLVQREFEMYAKALGSPRRRLSGYDIGGGTPSACKTENIARVVALARQHFELPDSVDISIETTPRIASRDPEKIHAYFQMGIRRISMGIQTVSPALLEAVGRPHTSVAYDRAATNIIRQAGFTKFNVDIMYGFAGQQLESVSATVTHVLSLNPEFVTLYRMRYKGTKLEKQAKDVSREEVNKQYALAKDMLQAAGYIAGAPGKNTFSRVAGDPGTSHYLTHRVIEGVPYLGIGLGAQTLTERTLAYNAGAAEKKLGNYRRLINAGKLPLQDIYHLSREAAVGKFVSVAFYFGSVNLAAFKRKFGKQLDEEFPKEVAFVREKGLMMYEGEGAEAVLRLTDAGLKAQNGVISLFYSPIDKAYLMSLPKILKDSFCVDW
jgi:oxygen-independent coproporphyrinogen-3 oxidase